MSSKPDKIVLQGNKVALRSLTVEDLETLHRLRYGEEDPEWKKWDAPYFKLEKLTLEEYIEKSREQIAKRPLCLMSIETDGKMIGAVSYYWEHEPSKWLEVGIVIYDPAYWSGGYGTDALRLWIDYLFREMPLVRVGLTTWSGNNRMMRVAEKLGMTLEGRMRKCRYYNGEYYDSIRMGILREEWEQANL